MEFAGTNYSSVGIAVVAGYAFGAAWYMVLSKPWIAATGRTEAEIKASFSPVVYIVVFIAQLVMAIFLAGAMGHVAAAAMTPGGGLLSGAIIWLGFVITTMVVNHGFGGQKRMLTVIDGTHWLGVLLIQGLIIGWIGV